MDTDKVRIPRELVEPLFALLGEIAISFAALEWALEEILACLIDTSDMSLGGSLLAGDFSLHRKLDYIRRLTGLRCSRNGDLRERLLDMCEKVDGERAARNRFIHGNWDFDPELLAKGSVRVLDMRWKAAKEPNWHWHRCRETVLSLDEIRCMRDRVGSLAAASRALLKELRASPLGPFGVKVADPG